MSETQPGSGYEAPPAHVTAHTIDLNGVSVAYRAECGWLVLRKKEKPDAEMFYSFYEVEESEPANRPITFVFNGGPGAASAYLHVGALGPRRVTFSPTGTPEPPPVSLVDNDDTWMRFSDLVFIDPIGTGFSRPIPRDNDAGGDGGKKSGSDDEEPSREYWKITRDLESLCEFITSFLSRHHRWDSPVFIAGESYGGFRVAKLCRMLQESYGVGLNGAILISPAIEFSLLDSSDYDVLAWIDRVPSMAAAARYHGRHVRVTKDSAETDVRTAAEEFATGELLTALVRGSSQDSRVRSRTLRRLAAQTGLPAEVVSKAGGRVSAQLFARELLRDQGRICGLYDATITAPDPFPARPQYEGPDPTLRSIERVFASGINAHLRRTLQVDTERRYHLLSMEVNRGWQVDIERHALESQIGAADDLRYGMSLNTSMKVRISHGIYDLVTPYFASNRIANLMALGEELRGNLSLLHYNGGHMFYAWDDSRAAFTRDVAGFYESATPSPRG